jgi:hypothetical protein
METQKTLLTLKIIKTTLNIFYLISLYLAPVKIASFAARDLISLYLAPVKIASFAARVKYMGKFLISLMVEI